MKYYLSENARLKDTGVEVYLPTATYNAYKEEYDSLLQSLGSKNSIFYYRNKKFIEFRVHFSNDTVFRINYYTNIEYDELYYIEFIEIERDNPLYQLNSNPIYMKKIDLVEE